MSYDTMTCDTCGKKMLPVGREITLGHPHLWVDGYVCAKKRCPGYGTIYCDGTRSQWPALTLMGEGIHIAISGAKKFRDALLG